MNTCLIDALHPTMQRNAARQYSSEDGEGKSDPANKN
jgi:hypothetical protein